MRVLVCGGRDYADRDAFNTVMRELTGITCIIQGGASGADQMALNWAIDHEIKHEDYPADWDLHGKAAGPIRNAKMLAEGRPDLVIAFPGGRGTADMVRKAKTAGLEVIEVK